MALQSGPSSVPSAWPEFRGLFTPGLIRPCVFSFGDRQFLNLIISSGVLGGVIIVVLLLTVRL
jgi:hypothetical protein